MVKPSGMPIMSATAQTDRQRGGTAILVHRGIAHHSLPIPGLTHLEATAIQVTIATKPEKIFASYLSHSRPLIGAELSCFGETGECRSLCPATSTPNK